MITHKDCLAKYGEPSNRNKFMVLWDVPSNIETGVIPNRLFCNTDLVAPLTRVFTDIVNAKLHEELLTFDGCFNIRKSRGLSIPSLHSWGVAVDFDAFRNQLGAEPKMNPKIVEIFEVHGFDWGGRWKRKDGMHFQLRTI